MYVKLLPKYLNPGSYPHPPHLASIYICGMTIAPRMDDGQR